MNITDEDNDTPIYTVETIEVAKWLVDHGAVLDRRNAEGLSVGLAHRNIFPCIQLTHRREKPSEHLAEEFPEISTFLASLGSTTSLPPPSDPSATSYLPPSSQLPSEHAANAASDQLAEQLMDSIRELATANNGGAEPSEEQIRRAVETVVLRGVNVGREMGQSASAAANSGTGNALRRDGEADGEEPKRSRTG